MAADRDNWPAVSMVSRLWREIISILVGRWAAGERWPTTPAAPVMWTLELRNFHREIPTAEEMMFMPLDISWPWRQMIRRWFVANPIGQRLRDKPNQGIRKIETFRLAMPDFITLSRRAVANPAIALIIIDEFIGAIFATEFHDWVISQYFMNCLFVENEKIISNPAAKSEIQRLFDKLMEKPTDINDHPPNIGEIMAADQPTRELVIVAMFMTRRYRYAKKYIRELVMSTPVGYSNCRELIRRTITTHLPLDEEIFGELESMFM